MNNENEFNTNEPEENLDDTEVTSEEESVEIIIGEDIGATIYDIMPIATGTKVTSNANDLSITISGKKEQTGTITWPAISLPSGVAINSCMLTGTATVTMSNGDVTITINGTPVTNGTPFSINLGTSLTTSIRVSCKGSTGKASGTVKFTNLVYTVTYEAPLVLESISLNNTSITVEKNKTKTITVIPNPSEYLLSDLQWSTNNSNCKIYPNPTGYDESTDKQTIYGLNCEILGYEVGTSTITVTTSDGTKSASCTVTVVESINNDIEIIWDHGPVLSETGEIVSMVDDGDTYIYTHMIHVDPINEYKVTITNQKGFSLAAYSYDSNCNYIGRLTQTNNNYFFDDAVNEVLNLPDNASYVRFRSTCTSDKSHKSLVDSQDKITINVNIRHTVIFKDWDGTILKTEIVEESASATAPSDPTREGYNFTGWDKDFTNVTSDLIITAQYAVLVQYKIVEYEFNNTLYDLIPEFNAEFTDYTYEDIVDGEVTTRTIYSSTLPTKVIFGYSHKAAENDVLCLKELSYLNTNNINDMEHLCANCNNLIKVNTEGWDTSNVVNMRCMFYGCNNLTSLDVSNFDTSNVVNMYCMFQYCQSLTSLDVSNFDTSNVTNMQNMFYDCRNLTSLDLSNFDTSNVTYMAYMFSNCNNLTSLDLSNFDTSNVTSM